MAEKRRLPPWLKVRMPGGPNYLELRDQLRGSQLHTVCEEARCPNIGGCWERRTATFMVLGDICTRACAYCAVTTGVPTGLDLMEPVRLAETVERMGLRYAVITSVNRDDLPDGGAFIFAQCIHQIRKRLPECKVEVLIPDFWRQLGRAIDGDGRRARYPEPQHRDGAPDVPPCSAQRGLRPVAGAALQGQGPGPRRCYQVGHDGRARRDLGRDPRDDA